MNMKKFMKTYEIGGEKINVEISPCSWIHPGYGLQISCTMMNTGNMTVIKHETVMFESASENVIDEMMGQVGIEHCACGNPRYQGALNRNRGKLCETCFIQKLNEGFAGVLEEEGKKVAESDLEMLRDGYRFVARCWIHPGFGDDVPVSFYFIKRPDDNKVRSLLEAKGSLNLEDFHIETLPVEAS